MSFGQSALVALAGFLAGAINAIIGSGSLITFPTLLVVGLPPLTANVTNTVGLVFGSGSAIVGYRRELRPQLRRALWLSIPSSVGAALGASSSCCYRRRCSVSLFPRWLVSPCS